MNKNHLHYDIRNTIFKNSHENIAKLLYGPCSDTIKCINIKKEEWYLFNNDTEGWERMDDKITLKTYFRKHLINIYTPYIKDYNDKSNNANNEGDIDIAKVWIERSGKCGDIINNLQIESYIIKLIKACATIFYVEDTTGIIPCDDTKNTKTATKKTHTKKETKTEAKKQNTKDLIMKFMDSQYEPSDNTTPQQVIWTHFKEWWREENKQKLPKMSELVDILIAIQKTTSYGYMSTSSKFNFIEKDNLSESEDDS